MMYEGVHRVSRDCGSSIWCLALLSGGSVVAGLDCGDLRVTNVLEDDCNDTVLEAHDGAVYALAAVPGGVASCGADGVVQLWSFAELCRSGVTPLLSDAFSIALPRIGRVALRGHTGAARCLALLRDGRLASGGDDGSVRLWDARICTRDANACTKVLSHGSAVRCLVALPCGGVVGGGSDGSVTLWSAAGVRTATLGGGPGEVPRAWVSSLALLRDGRIAVGHAGEGIVCVWDIVRRVTDVVLSGHGGGVWALVALPSGRLLSGSGDGCVRVWAATALAGRALCGACNVWGMGSGIRALAATPSCVLVGRASGVLELWQ